MLEITLVGGVALNQYWDLMTRHFAWYSLSVGDKRSSTFAKGFFTKESAKASSHVLPYLKYS